MLHYIKAWLVVVLFFCVSVAQAQSDSVPIQFSFNQQRVNNNQVEVSIKAVVPPGVKLYGLQKNEADALYSTIVFDSASQKLLSGPPQEQGNFTTANDATLNAAVRYAVDSVVWKQKVNAAPTDSVVLKGTLSYLYKKGEEYLPGEQELKFYLLPEQTTKATTTEANNSVENKSLLWIFLTAFAGGLLALLTPCVYSMIPVTVSFFTKRSSTRSQGIRNALYYSLSIIIIFTVLGFLVTLIFGPAALNNLATNWVANLIFFILFLVFGISFLGAFEITLPSSWSNKADSKAGSGSFAGIFFMALTLVVVSFSCTGPIIGNLLVLAAKGSYFGPLVGMLGFSVALALPFALFAFFPSKLNVLGKAGGWLNAVKVSLGFLELALALKFLSNADLAKGWRLLDREVFLSLWIVIFLLLGIYLLGKLKFHHDDELPRNDFGLPYLTVTRLFFAMAAFTFAVYMVPGLWGAPLKGISAFLPPMGTQDYVAGSGKPSTEGGAIATGAQAATDLPQPQKYYEQMKQYEPDVVRTYDLITYFDYKEALAVARKVKKPLMLDFTGINCVNCRKMEGQVWSDPQVMKRLKEDFVIVSLYVDVHNVELQPSEQYYSEALGKTVETLGDLSTDMQVTKFGANTQPYYFFLDENEQRLAPEGYGYDSDIQQFINHLDKVKAAYNK